jgi:Tfp pilus assembly protein PilV
MRRFSLMAVVTAAVLGVAGCQAYQQQQQATQQKIEQGNVILDRQRILMSTGGIDDAHKTLGELTYTEPLSPDSIDSAHINQKLREMAIAKWGRQVDAVIHINSKVGADATTMTVTGEAVEVTGNCSFCRHNHASPTMAPTSEMPIPD